MNGRAVPTLRVLVGMARAYRVTLDLLQKAINGNGRVRGAA